MLVEEQQSAFPLVRAFNFRGISKMACGFEKEPIIWLLDSLVLSKKNCLFSDFEPILTTKCQRFMKIDWELSYSSFQTFGKGACNFSHLSHKLIIEAQGFTKLLLPLHSPKSNSTGKVEKRISMAWNQLGTITESSGSCSSTYRNPCGKSKKVCCITKWQGFLV